MWRAFLAAMLVTLAAAPAAAQVNQNRFANYLQYLRRESTRQELGLSAEQIDTVRAIETQYAAAQREGRPNAADLSREERTKLITQLNQKQNALDEEYRVKLLKLLTPEQTQRLKQIDWQNFGAGAVWQTEVAQALKITPEQQARLDTLHQELERQVRAKGIEEVRKLREQAIAELLTAEQKEQLAQLKGKPFDVAQFQDAPALRSGPGPNPILPVTSRNIGLYTHRAVAKELALTEEQQAKIQALTDQANQKLRAITNSLSTALRDLPPEERTKKVAELRTEQAAKMSALEDEFLPQLTAVLTPEQSQRILQIRWQAAGATALLDKELIKQLKLSEEQQAKISATVKEASEKLAAMSGPTGPTSFATAREARAVAGEINTARNKAILETLTAEQRDQLESLKGKPFDVSQLALRGPSGFDGRGAATPSGPLSVAGLNAFNQPAILKELAATADQQARIRELSDQVIARTRAIAPNLSQLGQLSPEERTKMLAEANEKRSAIQSEFLPKLTAVLTAEQWQRMQQIRWQASGTAALLDDELRKQLALSPEQREKMEAAIKDAAEKLATARQTDERQAKTREIVAARDKLLLETLTAEQKEQLARLKGKEFDLSQLRGDGGLRGGFSGPPGRNPE